VKKLSDIKNGKIVEIQCIRCGFGLKRRLTSLGLYNGTVIQVIKNDNRSPIILKVFNSKIVLGRGQAMKINVEEVN
jgi:ferrous iron transport protein A